MLFANGMRRSRTPLLKGAALTRHTSFDTKRLTVGEWAMLGKALIFVFVTCVACATFAGEQSSEQKSLEQIREIVASKSFDAKSDVLLDLLNHSPSEKVYTAASDALKHCTGAKV